jgi:hypothetical protein
LRVSAEAGSEALLDVNVVEVAVMAHPTSDPVASIGSSVAGALADWSRPLSDAVHASVAGAAIERLPPVMTAEPETVQLG